MLDIIAPSDIQLLNEVQERLPALLPKTWTSELATRESGSAADLVIAVRAPDGSSGRFLVEANSDVEPRQVPDIVRRLRTHTGLSVIAAPFLSLKTREAIDREGAGYFDLAGNSLLRLDEPGLLIRTSGAIRSPWSPRRQGRTLRGPKAGSIVRFLCDQGGVLSVSQIAKATAVDSGYVSRVLDLLEREDLIERAKRGPVQRVAWEGVIRRWVNDYRLLKSNTYATFLDPRVLERLPQLLEPLTVRYAVTGSFAALYVRQIATRPFFMAYVDDPHKIASALYLTPTTRNPNVILLRPFDAVVYERGLQREGVRCVAMSQLAADLLTGPGRMPEEGEAILEWMRSHESQWRN